DGRYNYSIAEDFVVQVLTIAVVVRRPGDSHSPIERLSTRGPLGIPQPWPLLVGRLLRDREADEPLLRCAIHLRELAPIYQVLRVPVHGPGPLPCTTDVGSIECGEPVD